MRVVVRSWAQQVEALPTRSAHTRVVVPDPHTWHEAWARKRRGKTAAKVWLPYFYLSFTNSLVNVIVLVSGDFTSRWCNERKLNENTAVVLRQRGFIDEQSLASLRAEDVPTLGLTSKAEECVLRKVLAEQEGVRPLHVDVADSSVQFREFCSFSIILERCGSQCYVCLSRFRSRSTETSQPCCKESERTEFFSFSREFPWFDRSQYRQLAFISTILIFWSFLKINLLSLQVLPHLSSIELEATPTSTTVTSSKVRVFWRDVMCTQTCTHLVWYFWCRHDSSKHEVVWSHTRRK